MIILNLSRGWRKIMRGVNFCRMFSDKRIEYNLPHGQVPSQNMPVPHF